MNKNLIIVAAVVIMVAVIGYMFYSPGSLSLPVLEESSTTVETDVETVESVTVATEAEDATSEIEDELSAADNLEIPDV